jgi:hypothetical protein
VETIRRGICSNEPLQGPEDLARVWTLIFSNLSLLAFGSGRLGLDGVGRSASHCLLTQQGRSGNPDSCSPPSPQRVAGPMILVAAAPRPERTRGLRRGFRSTAWNI